MTSFAIQEYLPNTTTTLRYKSNGAPKSRYTFSTADQNFLNIYQSFFNLNKPGVVKVWRKEYLIGGVWCTKTYAVLLFGLDGSITEVGDWTISDSPCSPNTLFGYKTLDKTTASGLIWCPAGGLSTTPVLQEAFIARQNFPGDSYRVSTTKTYSKAGLVKHHPTYMLPSGQVFEDVVQLVMYHGNSTTTPVRCEHCPVGAEGAYYQSKTGYNSYAIELWLARDVGIIREKTPFIEDASYFGVSNCSGTIFDSTGNYDSFI